MNFEPVRTKTDLETLDPEQLMEGYFSAVRGDPEPGPNRGRSFWHGWRTRMMDLGMIEIDDAHRQLVREVAPGGVLSLHGVKPEERWPKICSVANTVLRQGQKK